jgi:hypothetical protein
MGRFLTRDTWAGDTSMPLSLNRWNYTYANPINYVDPSGRISERDNIEALVIAADLRIKYNVTIIKDWGYLNSVPTQVYGFPMPLNGCEWHYGYWRNPHEIDLVRKGVERLATKMGGPEKFKAAMKNRPVEITRVQTLPIGFTNNTGLALPEIPLYFMVDGLMLPDAALDYGDIFATYTTIHELGHVWDIRNGMSLSLNMALQLGNTKYGDNFLLNCLYGPAEPRLRFLCAISNWQYNEANEPAPGEIGDQYARTSFSEDWAEAVAYTVYPEYGAQYGNAYFKIGPIRKIFVEMMMNNLP